MKSFSHLYLTYASLVLLVAVTVALSYSKLGVLNFPLSLLIAALKAALILLVFMELKKQLPVTLVMVSTISLWGVLFGALMLADYLTRPWPVNEILRSNTPHADSAINEPAQTATEHLP